MGLYDDRLDQLSEARRSRRVAVRRGSLTSRPFAAPVRRTQSLHFGREAGWTESKARQWARANGYKARVTNVTEQHIRIRQFNPNGLKVKRNVTLGRGIRAVVAREEDMKTKRRRSVRSVKAKVRSTRRSAKRTVASRPRRRVRQVRSTVAAPRRRARRVRAAVAAPRRRRRHVRRTREASRRVSAPRRRRTVRAPVVQARRRRRRHHARAAVAAPRRRRTVRAPVVQARRRRRRRHVAKAWFGNTPGHRKAAKKGHSRKRKSNRTRESIVASPRRRKHARRRHHARETTYSVASKRRRRHHARSSKSVVRSNSRRSYRARSVGSTMKSVGKHLGMMAFGIGSAGLGYVLANGLDRFLATYNPAGDPSKLPANKFTSDGAGTLANALNVASPPHLVRIGAAIGAVVVPAVAAMYTKNRVLRSSLEGVALGAGVNAFALLWSNVLMPMLAPKDGDVEKLKSSYVARLYPTEVAAKLNLETMTTTGSLSSSGSPDVGPFAVGEESPYPDAVQALRRQAGLQGEGTYPSADQALTHAAGLGYPNYGGRPAAPRVNQWRGMHPGNNRNTAAWSQRWGNQYQSRVPGGGKHHHHHCMLRAKAAYPSYTDAQLHQWCLAHPSNTHPYLYEAPSPYGATALADGPDAGASPDAPADMPTAAAPAPSAFPPAGGPTPDPMGPPVYAPGPTVGPGPGPVAVNQECGCVGDEFLGFMGDAEDTSNILFDTTSAN